MKILGLNHGEINAAAALVVDGEVVAGAAEERFTREKKTKDFPINAVRYCLEAGGLEWEEVDAVAQAWNPGRPGSSSIRWSPAAASTAENDLYAIPDNLYRLTERETDEWVKMSFPDGSAMPPVYHIQHHRTHSANSFYLSEFEEAAILTADWRGEFETTTLGMGSGNSFEILASQNMPHSLGAFYAAFTELLGYQPDSEEWKVMALSAYDVDASDFYQKIRRYGPPSR
ncbi:MAG: carbamoyltransferase N-terminal domain-containing protein [Balneolaceae bacterium]|nr:carbamoyltransferase N-terminal domain-containing protein [Balneolaceae bacterium]